MKVVSSKPNNIKSILSKAQHPHIYNFNKVCLICTPNGYNENFPLQCNGLTCAIHPDEDIVLYCKICEKKFNSYSYLFHNTSKNPCPKTVFVTKSKKTKAKKNTSSLSYSIKTILENYYEDPIFPTDKYVNQFFKKIREQKNGDKQLSALIDKYFETQKKLSHNKNLDKDIPFDTKNLDKISEDYSIYIGKLSDILYKTQRYNTRSRHTDVNTEICNSLSKSDKINIENTMNKLNDILDKENDRYKEINEEMKNYYNYLIHLIQPLMNKLRQYQNIVNKQTEEFQNLYLGNGSRNNKYNNFDYMKKEEKNKNDENENELDIEKLKKRGMLSAIDIDRYYQKQNSKLDKPDILDRINIFSPSEITVFRVDDESSSSNNTSIVNSDDNNNTNYYSDIKGKNVSKNSN